MARAHRLVDLIRGAGLGTALAALTLGCQTPPPPAPPKAVVRDFMAEARGAMARKDYGGAVALLRQALVSEPARLEGHYLLGVSASYLDLEEEAVREFEWVVQHGPANSEEVQMARSWLAARSRAAAAEQPEEEQAPDRARLAGTAMWSENGAVKPAARFQIFLKGIPGTPTEPQTYYVRTDMQGQYRLSNIVPGEYMLTNRIAGPPIWRLKVAVKAGDDTVLDLTADNSIARRNDFPGLE